jgi:hypothetical protein
MRDGGKGDLQRPLGVTMEQFDNAWDRIFKKVDIKLKPALDDSIEQNGELYQQLADHEKECGK